MKRLFISLLIAVVCFTASAQQNVVKINPLGLLIGAASVSYEKTLSPSSSFQINGLFGGMTFSDFSYSTWGAGADYRFYLTKSKVAPTGFYVAPGLAYNNMNFKVDTEKASASAFAIKGMLGYQWIWGGFDLDLFAGLNYTLGGKVTVSGSDYSVNGFGPALGVAIGYAF